MAVQVLWLAGPREVDDSYTFEGFMKLEESGVRCKNSSACLCVALMYHEFHETCHSVTFSVLVNSHQR